MFEISMEGHVLERYENEENADKAFFEYVKLYDECTVILSEEIVYEGHSILRDSRNLGALMPRVNPFIDYLRR